MDKTDRSPTRCIHCLALSDEPTLDHVFPKSWYPETTPTDMEKWQAPACRPCNEKYGRIENDLLRLLGLCLHPQAYEAFGISGKATRSLDPSQGRNVRDAKHRLKHRERVLNELILASEVPPLSVLPGFGPHPQSALEDQVAIGVPKEHLEDLVKKIVRGITYIIKDQYIGEHYSIEVFFETGEYDLSLQGTLQHFGSRHHRGPGIVVEFASPHDDPVCGLFKLVVWGRLTAWAIVRPRGHGVMHEGAQDKASPISDALPF